MFLGFYFRLLRASAAATAMMMIAKPMAMYVAVGAAFPGGMVTGLGVGAIVWVGAEVGVDVAAVGACVGAAVTTAGAGVAAAGPMSM